MMHDDELDPISIFLTSDMQNNVNMGMLNVVTVIREKFSKGCYKKKLFLIVVKSVHTPGPRIMRIHLVQNSNSAKFGPPPKKKFHLVRICSTIANEKAVYLVKIHLVQNLH